MMEDIEKIREAYESLKRLHMIANGTVESLQLEIRKLQIENEFLRSQLVNAGRMVAIQKKVVEDSLQASRETHERDYLEIAALRKRA